MNDDELVIERHYHLCSADPSFVPQFKKRYNLMDPSLLDNKNMVFAIDNEMDIADKIKDFIKDVTCPISEELERRLSISSEQAKLSSHKARKSSVKKKNELERVAQASR